MFRMSSRFLAALLLYVWQGTSSLVGQATPLKLDTKRLASGVDTLAVFLIHGNDTVRTGSLIDELRAEKGRLVRIYATSDQILGNSLDTIVSSLEDLRPLSYATQSARQVAQLSFNAGRVVGWSRLPNGDSTTIRAELPTIVYDGSSFDLVIRASLLAPNFELAVPSFLVGSNTVGTLTGSVTGTETVEDRPCWVVKTNFAGMPVTFWIDKENRELRRQLMQPRVDMSILFARPKSGRASGRAT